MLALAAVGLAALLSCQTLGWLPPRRPSHNASPYAQWRFIALRHAGAAACPDAGASWRGRPLFSVARRPQDDPAVQAAADSLGRFCVYELTEKAAKAGRELPPPPASPDLEQVAPDVAAVGISSSDDLPQMTAPLLNAQFERAAGMAGPSSSAALGPVPVPPVPPVPAVIPVTPVTRLSFLDTQPDGLGVPQTRGNSAHGYTVAHLGAELICAAGRSCPQIATRLAMPLLSFDSQVPQASPADPQHGGYFGLVTDVATAIVDEVNAWQNAGAPRHLVLNLSLGWDPALTRSGTEAPLRATPGKPAAASEKLAAVSATAATAMTSPALSVHEALRYAAQHGVLVIVAAGNVSSGTPHGDGPLLPAAWGKETIPAVVGGPAAGRQSAGPLLYPVGGVQADGRRLGNMRPGAMPQLAAFGDHAVVADSPGKPDQLLLPAMTGSSVSAAVVSAVATAVWDQRPDLDRNQVMAQLAAGATPLGYRAEFGAAVGGTLPEVRRVSLCAALTAACANGGCKSWSPPPGGCGGEIAGFTGSMRSAQAGFVAQHHLDGAQFAQKSPPPPCSSSSLHYNSGQWPANACPDDDSPGLDTEPYVFPQPTQDPCPTCTVGPGGDGNGVAQSPAVVTATTLSQQASAAGSSTNSVRLVANRTGAAPATLTALASSASQTWTLRLKIRDDWPATEPGETRRYGKHAAGRGCLTDATLELEVAGPPGPTGQPGQLQGISYAVGEKVCAGDSLELSGIAIPEASTVESAWLSFLEDGMAVRSQLLVVAP